MLNFVIAGFLLWASPETQVINRSLAEVGGQVVTSRDVVLAGVLDRWLLLQNNQSKTTRNHIKALNRKDWILQDGSEAFKQQARQLVLDHVVALEAKTFNLGEVESAQVDSMAAQVVADLKGWESWAELKFTHSEIVSALLVHLRAKSFLRIKIKSAGVQPSEEDVRAYYDQNKPKFGGLPFAQFKDNIRDFLSQRSLEASLKDWYELLKRKYQVRYLSAQNL
jgi:hypothetical protein